MFQSSLALFSALSLLVAPHLGEPTAPRFTDIDVAVVGRVTDAATGQPIRGARLQLDGASAVASSNAFGRYLLTLDDGRIGREVTISATVVGYAPGAVSMIVADGANVADFALDALPVERDELEADVAPGPTLQDRITGALGIAGRAASASEMVRSFAPPPGGGFDREGYAHIAENTFRAVAPNPLSSGA